MKIIGLMTLIFVAFNLFFTLITPTDDTDKSRWNRSGLSLYTDHKTGLQYIKGGLFGDLTPRLDADGKHMKAE